jgi:hypothetical protein
MLVRQIRIISDEVLYELIDNIPDCFGMIQATLCYRTGSTIVDTAGMDHQQENEEEKVEINLVPSFRNTAPGSSCSSTLPMDPNYS